MIKDIKSEDQSLQLFYVDIPSGFEISDIRDPMINEVATSLFGDRTYIPLCSSFSYYCTTLPDPIDAAEYAAFKWHCSLYMTFTRVWFRHKSDAVEFMLAY